MASQPPNSDFEYAGMGMPHRCYPMRDLQRSRQTAIRLLETQRLITEPMIGQRFQYSDAAAAYRFIDEHPNQSIKTFLYYDSVAG